MKEIIKALKLRTEYNTKEFLEIVREFGLYTNQVVPEEAIERWIYCGLNNVDFLTSDFLNDFGLLNLLQFEKKYGNRENKLERILKVD